MRLICTVPLLPPGTHVVADGDVLLHVTSDGNVFAAPNRCAHQNGRFGKPDGCVLTCGLHGWRLDASTMTYLSPNEHTAQPCHIVQSHSDGHDIFEADVELPWNERQPRRGLLPSAFTLRFRTDDIVIASGGLHVHWPPSERPTRLEVWLPLGNAGRLMWLPSNTPDLPALLVEVVGHTVLLASSPLTTSRPPSPVDVLVTHEGARSLLDSTSPRVVAFAGDPPPDTQDPSIRVWNITPGLVLDVASGDVPEW